MDEGWNWAKRVSQFQRDLTTLMAIDAQLDRDEILARVWLELIDVRAIRICTLREIQFPVMASKRCKIPGNVNCSEEKKGLLYRNAVKVKCAARTSFCSLLRVADFKKRAKRSPMIDCNVSKLICVMLSG